jgi:hypothetical protein
MHFDDGHTGAGPKSASNGLCAVFVVTEPDRRWYRAVHGGDGPHP